MQNIKIAQFEVILDEEIKNKLFSLLPQDANPEEVKELLDKMNKTDRDWVLNVFEKARLLIKKKRKFYILNKILFFLLICDIVCFLVYGFLERNSEHDVYYYSVAILYVIVAFVISWLYNIISRKFLQKKLKSEEL